MGGLAHPGSRRPAETGVRRPARLHAEPRLHAAGIIDQRSDQRLRGSRGAGRAGSAAQRRARAGRTSDRHPSTGAAGRRRSARNGQITDDHRAQYSRINSSFHETIHASAGSRLLNDTVYLCQQVPVSSPRYIVAFRERDVRRRHDDHHRIFEAIINREPWRAEMLMRDHVASVKSSLVRSLSSPAAVDEAPQLRQPRTRVCLTREQSSP